MKATIIYPQDVVFAVEVPPGKQFNVAERLAYVYEQCQNDLQEITGGESHTAKLNKTGAKLRSMMVGDIVLTEGAYYMADMVGWLGISEAQARLIQRIPFGTRCMGWDYMAQHYPLGEPVRF